ncbi:hypothetical protein GWI33_008468 [Rhynchophorus ferrugineus]|uniref:Uncharacterized protein n=1 Tax=Rhynchophorus ferrugineus TaxID=354439 RepID=A0A834ICM1_RHYFE|nr:hypothetical protein GWI33_008468 [Rhynchophorus ferrugineus]
MRRSPPSQTFARTHAKCALDDDKITFCCRRCVLVIFWILSFLNSLSQCDASVVGTQETLMPCPVFGEDRCRCTPDLHEFQCRGAGFTNIPLLPYSITKL